MNRERDTYELRRPASLVLVSFTPDGTPVYRPLTPEAERSLIFNGEMTGSIPRVGTTRNGVKPPPPPMPSHGGGRHARTVPHYVWICGLLMVATALAGIVWLIYASLMMLFALLPLILGVFAILVGVTAALLRRGGGVSITQNVNL
jgi:hypothetical protein